MSHPQLRHTKCQAEIDIDALFEEPYSLDQGTESPYRVESSFRACFWRVIFTAFAQTLDDSISHPTSLPNLDKELFQLDRPISPSSSFQISPSPVKSLSTKSLFRVGMISFISGLSTVTRAQRALFMAYQWLSEFVTQYWFSMYCGSREIQSLTNIVPRSTEQSGSSGSSLYECSISYRTLKRSFCATNLTTTNA